MEDLLDRDETEAGEDFKSIRDHLVLEMLYDTGMRRSELAGLRDEDIDYERGLIKVTGKRNKQRLIPFAARLKELMQRYQQVRNREVGKTVGFLFVKTVNKSQLRLFIL